MRPSLVVPHHQTSDFVSLNHPVENHSSLRRESSMKMEELLMMVRTLTLSAVSKSQMSWRKTMDNGRKCIKYLNLS